MSDDVKKENFESVSFDISELKSSLTCIQDSLSVLVGNSFVPVSEPLSYSSKHHYCRAVGSGEKRGLSRSKVDPKGYIPLRTQVTRALEAGERLVAFRREEFDWTEGDSRSEDDLEPLPFFNPDFMPSVDMPRLAEIQNMKAAQFRAQQASAIAESAASTKEPQTTEKDTLSEE